MKMDAIMWDLISSADLHLMHKLSVNFLVFLNLSSHSRSHIERTSKYYVDAEFCFYSDFAKNMWMTSKNNSPFLASFLSGLACSTDYYFIFDKLSLKNHLQIELWVVPHWYQYTYNNIVNRNELTFENSRRHMPIDNLAFENIKIVLDFCWLDWHDLSDLINVVRKSFGD